MFPDGFIPLNTAPKALETSLSIKLVPQIILQGNSGDTAVLEVSGNPDGPWTQWKTVIIGDSGTSEIIVDESVEKRFYRVVD